MLIPGPSRASTLLRLNSRLVMLYSSSTSSSLNVQPRRVPFGREKAFVPTSNLSPDGPSVVQAAGIPKALKLSVRPPKAEPVPGVTFGEDMPSPLNKLAKSSLESWAINSSSEILLLYTSDNL